MINYADAFKKPFTDVKKLLIGILLSILPVINWFAMGFAIECSGLGRNKKSKKMPEWDDWGDYFVKGLLGTLIIIIYLIPTLLILILSLGSYFGYFMMFSFRSIMPFGRGVNMNFATAFPNMLGLLPLLLLSLLLGLFAVYISPMAILNYLKKNNFSDAFKLKIVLKKVFNQDYFIAWIIVALVFGLAGAIINRIPVIGSALISFVSQVTAYTMFGEVYSRSGE